MNTHRLLIVLAAALMLLAGNETLTAMPQGKSRGGGGGMSKGGGGMSSGGGGISRGGGGMPSGGGGMSRGGGGMSHSGSGMSGSQSHSSFPKYTPSPNTGANSRSYQGSSKHSGYTQSHSNQFHSNTYYGNYYGSNRNYGYNRGLNYLNISPYGLGYSYYNNGFGLSVGTSRYYPSYGYSNYSYGVLPSSAYYYGGSYAAPYYSTPVYPDLTAPYSSYTDVLAAHDLLSNGEVVAGYPPASPEMAASGMAAPTPMIGSASAEANNLQMGAEIAFRDGRYEEAARLVDQAIGLDARNGFLYLFSSQARFATGQFREAVDRLKVAIELLPEDQWGFVVENFRSVYGQNDFVSQTNRLSDHITRNPLDFAARTLRGYQYGALGYPDAATKDFAEALKLNPDDGLTRKLQPVFATEAPVTAPIEVQSPKPADGSLKQENPNN